MCHRIQPLTNEIERLSETTRLINRSLANVNGEEVQVSSGDYISRENSAEKKIFLRESQR